MAHLIMCITAFGFLVPRWFDVFIPLDKLNEGSDMYTPTAGMVAPESIDVQGDEKGYTMAKKVSPSAS